MTAQTPKTTFDKYRKKRLYRSRTDRIIAGVCGGIGHYFDIDPVWIRIIWVVTMVLTGLVPCALIYIGLAIVVPLEPEGKKS